MFVAKGRPRPGVAVFGPCQIGYGAIVPKASECENLLATLALEGDHGLVVSQVAHGVDAIADDSETRVTHAQALDLPRKRWAVCRPFLQESGLGTLAVAVDALGAERVRAVMMPFDYTSELSKSAAQLQATALGVDYQVISISGMYLPVATMVA